MKPGQTAPKNIDDYIADFSPEIREKLQKIRETIRKAAPKAEEAISYMMPTFKLYGNLVHFAAFKNHIGFHLVDVLNPVIDIRLCGETIAPGGHYDGRRNSARN